jgi:hypothetical protein
MHVFPITFEIDGYPAGLLLAQFSEELTIEALFDAVYNGVTNERQQAIALVLRPDVQDQFSPGDLLLACEGKPRAGSAFLAAIAQALAAPDIHLSRFPTLPVYVLHSGGGIPVLSPNVNPGATTPDLDRQLRSPEALARIRDAEMRVLIERSRAHLPPIEGSYYLPPSKKPARSFLRVGNIQYSRHAIDAVTFWLLPHVWHADAILADTWSLSSIALNVSRVLAALRGESPIPVEMLSRYHDASEESQAALIEILDRLAHAAVPAGPRSQGDATDLEEFGRDLQPLRIACLVSATQTGSLVALLEEQREVSGLDTEFAFIALYRLGETGDLPSLCDMSKDPGFLKLDPDEIGDRVPIGVDAQVYFPLRYITVELTPLAVHAQYFRPFLDMVQGKDILSVHRDQRSDGPIRHHGVHVDTDRLIQLPAFVAQFEQRLIALDPVPQVIITPLHDAADRLGRLAVEILQGAKGAGPTLVRHTSLEFRSNGPTAQEDARVRRLLKALPAASAILVLDDCYITGARLTGYQTRLRQLAVSARLHYLVGLARPPDGEAWKLFKRRVCYRAIDDREHHAQNSVDCVFQLCLPNWLGSDCPWCREAAFYQHWSSAEEDAELPDFLMERQATLADRDSGLKDNLFLVDPVLPSLRLYSGSVFAPQFCNQAEVFVAVAAAVQQLRIPSGQKPALGARHYPIATVVEAKNYLHEMYTDSVLRASVLRGAALEELVYPEATDERERSNFIASILTSTHNDINDLAAEIFLAHAFQKCAINEAVQNAGLSKDMTRLLAHARAYAGRP